MTLNVNDLLSYVYSLALSDNGFPILNTISAVIKLRNDLCLDTPKNCPKHPITFVHIETGRQSQLYIVSVSILLTPGLYFRFMKLFLIRCMYLCVFVRKQQYNFLWKTLYSLNLVFWHLTVSVFRVQIKEFRICCKKCLCKSFAQVFLLLSK